MKRAHKPYLTSVGLSFPLFGLWVHRYFPTKRKFRLGKYGPFVMVSYKRCTKELDRYEL